MSYVSFNDVIELNGILKDKGLNFRIHRRHNYQVVRSRRIAFHKCP